MLDDGSALFLYIGRSVPQAVIEALFGTPSHLRPAHVEFLPSSPAAQRVALFVDSLRRGSIFKQELRVVWSDELGSSGGSGSSRVLARCVLIFF